jgi:hypothetical protein
LLSAKDTNSFWRCWKSKFETRKSSFNVDGVCDERLLATNFKAYFSGLIRPNSSSIAEQLDNDLQHLLADYSGDAQLYDDLFNIDNISDAILRLKVGKAADLDSLQSEHFINCHPIIGSILLRLFNMIMYFGHVPSGFRASYTIPLIKVKEHFSQSLSCNDFRGIAISSVISKIFEYCLLSKFSSYLSTSQRQFGFKKNNGCSTAIYTARAVINNYIDGGSTVNLLALDVSKAFDKVNHSALFLKLMKRKIPRVLLDLLRNWLPKCYTCIKWHNYLSGFFSLSTGVRQGSVLAPLLFSIYIDDIIAQCVRLRCGEILVYADDILLIARSLNCLQRLLLVVEKELTCLDLLINCKKSACMRVGPRFDATCTHVILSNGCQIPWVSELRYLGIFLTASNRLKCSFADAKRRFCCAANSVLGKLMPSVNEDNLLFILSQKCIPILLYGTECCLVSKRDLSSLDFTVTKFIMKIFKTSNSTLVRNCMDFFHFKLPSECIATRQQRFLQKFNHPIASLYIR